MLNLKVRRKRDSANRNDPSRCYPFAMELTLIKHSALTIMRALRSDKNRTRFRLPACGSKLLAPDPFPKKHWSHKSLSNAIAKLPVRLDPSKLETAAPNRKSRIQAKGVSCTVYNGGVPDDSFIHLGDGIAISGPELLFAELAESMHPLEHLMLGHELCGTFSRDADDPYNGPITYKVPPATSVEKIARFLDKAKSIRGIDAARSSLALLNDNAWSPTESLVAALLRPPIDSLGFDMGQLTLNPRVELERGLPGAKESRVPDIVIEGTPVGLNYDGLAHLDLGSIVKAAINVGTDPGSAQMGAILDKAVRDVREKLVDDIRRNRELAADGLVIFPILKEDLYMPGGIEQVVERLVDRIEQECNRNMRKQRKILAGKALARARHRMMLSLLPGNHERNVQVERFIQGHPMYDGPSQVEVFLIEL